MHQWMPDAKFMICLTEREIPEAIQKDDCFDRVVLSRDIWDGNFDRFIFKHSIVEASTAVKGRFFQYLMSSYPEEDYYIYLDPDCYVYGDFEELRQILIDNPIVLCPHLLHPGNIDMELSSTAHGVYNLGFLAVSNSEEAKKLIDWWTERLYLYCYDDIGNGIFTDQKWMDLAPCFFNVYILKHYGYDLAPWGLKGIEIKGSKNKYYVQEMPLRFIHFSGFGEVAETCMDKWLGEDAKQFRQIYNDYAVEHSQKDFDGISQTQWSYDNYDSGEKIDRKVRELYRKDWELMFSIEDPFKKSNEYFMDYFKEKGNFGEIKKSQGNRILRLTRATVHTFRAEGALAVITKTSKKIKAKYQSYSGRKGKKDGKENR